MATVNVQFADSSELVVVGVFACEQDAEACPHQAQIDDSDQRYLAFANPLATLAGAKAAQVAAIAAACQAAITAGFVSSALGAAHTYPAQMTDQQNLAASVLASLMPSLPSGWTTPFWCEDGSGNWLYASHTATQIQQVGQDGKTAVIAAIQKKATLVAQINAATTVAAAQVISW
ncbi:hypothetical protein ACI2VH_03000 [Ralstonia nicotianae]